MGQGMTDRQTVAVFNKDARFYRGYGYTTNTPLSSHLATRRWHEALLSLADIRGARVLDVGCGDGVMTVSLYDRGRPVSIHAIDPAESAIDVARSRIQGRAIIYSVGDGYWLPFAADSFDVAYLGAILHHVERPLDVIREALRVAPRLLVLEPNGWIPVL
jgi:ubiquinone/menaquinone biosynthesis C-methylase UbiE